MSTPTPIRTAFALNGQVHVVTADGRLWKRRQALDGHEWKEIPGPCTEDMVPSWLRDQPAPPVEHDSGTRR